MCLDRCFEGKRLAKSAKSKNAKELDKHSSELYRKIIQQCRRERKGNTKLTVREVARRMGKTENYVSSIENGREIPKLKTFLEYLIVSGFQTTPLTRLSIDHKNREGEEQKTRGELVDMAYDMNSKQLDFMVKQAKIIEDYPDPPRRKRS